MKLLEELPKISMMELLDEKPKWRRTSGADLLIDDYLEKSHKNLICLTC